MTRFSRGPAILPWSLAMPVLFDGICLGAGAAHRNPGVHIHFGCFSARVAVAKLLINGLTATSMWSSSQRVADKGAPCCSNRERINYLELIKDGLTY